jgi:hypothetical protein
VDGVGRSMETKDSRLGDSKLDLRMFKLYQFLDTPELWFLSFSRAEQSREQRSATRGGCGCSYAGGGPVVAGSIPVLGDTNVMAARGKPLAFGLNSDRGRRQPAVGVRLAAGGRVFLPCMGVILCPMRRQDELTSMLSLVSR